MVRRLIAHIDAQTCHLPVAMPAGEPLLVEVQIVAVAGLDNLDLAALRKRDVEVIHGGGINARAVAEYVMGSCLDLARRLSRSDREVRRGGWTRHVGLELAGQTLGVIGLGATGAETAHSRQQPGGRRNQQGGASSDNGDGNAATMPLAF